jgi:hypothetical protein
MLNVFTCKFCFKHFTPPLIIDLLCSPLSWGLLKPNDIYLFILEVSHLNLTKCGNALHMVSPPVSPEMLKRNKYHTHIRNWKYQVYDQKLKFVVFKRRFTIVSQERTSFIYPTLWTCYPQVFCFLMCHRSCVCHPSACFKLRSFTSVLLSLKGRNWKGARFRPSFKGASQLCV